MTKSTGRPIGRPPVPMVGLRFDLLICEEVVTDQRAEDGSLLWWCRCDCGNRVRKSGVRLRTEKKVTQSCGCHKPPPMIASDMPGMSGTAEHGIWYNMLERCHRPGTPGWDAYGAVGIEVCEAWRSSFKSFYRDMGLRPTSGHSLDRIDNARGYSPDNCRWATSREQSWNRSVTRMITYGGEVMPLKAWAQRLGLGESALSARIARHGVDRAIEMGPPKRRERVTETGHRSAYHNATHGMTKTPEFHTWQNIKDRCHNPRSKAWPRYGGAGVTVCDRWRDSFPSFYEDMGDRPSPTHSLDRIDNTLGYGPENCRWATRQEQAWNRRTTRMIEHQGESMPVNAWAKRLGITFKTMSLRIERFGAAAAIEMGSPKKNRTITPR